MTELRVQVYGTPSPQGSKTGFVVRGRDGAKARAVVVDKNPKHLKSWRQEVRTATLQAITHAPTDTHPLHGPVAVAITFWMPRPKYHYRTGLHAHELRPNAPVWVDRRPDVDKLVRSTLDALTEALAYDDDAQVARLVIDEKYAPPGQTSGADITITPLAAATTTAPEEQGVLL